MSTRTPVPVTRETLNDLVEFDVPFRIIPSNEGPLLIGSNAIGIIPDCVTLMQGSLQLLIDFDHPDHSSWEPISGFSGQYSYSGPVMHPSEFLGGGMADYVLDVETSTVYVVMEVFAEDDEGVAFDDPAGWILLRLRDNDEKAD